MIKKTSDFIDADDRNSMDEEAGDNGEDSDDLDCFDSVCAICDNGGELLWYVSLIFVIRRSLFNIFYNKKPIKI